MGFYFWNNSSTQPVQPTDTNVHTEMPKAAIIDGLYSLFPNPSFVQSVTGNLSAAGFKVDVFRGENVTINLLRNVNGYKVLILRLHSAVGPDGFLYLFSGEPYSPTEYVFEQRSGSVRKGITDDRDEFFAINAAILGKENPSGLNDSTLILMGCNGTSDEMTIDVLLEQRVKTYISWSGKVGPAHTDEATMILVNALYIQKLNVGNAVAKTMTEVGPDPTFKSILEYRVRNG